MTLRDLEIFRLFKVNKRNKVTLIQQGPSVDNEEFTVDTMNGISIVKINLIRATHRELNDLLQVLNLILEANQNKIIIDFVDCQYVDSMIIGLLIITVKKVRKLEGDIRFIMPHENIKNIISQTRLDKIFKQFGTVEQALTSFSY